MTDRKEAGPSPDRDSIESSGRTALGLILARGGSVGIPGKNARPFLGEPLIARAVRILSESGVPARVVVSTDDPEIARHAREAGAEVPFVRPSELAGPDTPSRAAMAHAVRELLAQESAGGRSLGTDVVLFQATSPCCRPADIARAWSQYTAEGRGALVSVTPVTEPPHWMGEVVEGRFRYLFADRATRRQDLPAVYRLNGAINIVSVADLLSGAEPVAEPSAYIMPLDRSVDLDEPEDWERAERIARREEELA